MINERERRERARASGNAGEVATGAATSAAIVPFLLSRSMSLVLARSRSLVGGRRRLSEE